MGLSGKTVYQITGTNITEEAQLQRELEEDNLRLKAHESPASAIWPGRP